MERVTVIVEIVNGKTVFREVREDLPLFQRTGDLTETLGQYAGTINSNPKPESENKAADKK